MGLRDFLKQQKETLTNERNAQLAQQWEVLVESLKLAPHPLSDAGEEKVDLYVKSVLILRAEMPLAYSDPEEGKKQFRLFARSLGISKEHQKELEDDVALYDEPAKTETLLMLFSQGDAAAMTCFMCDLTRLHGALFKFEGAFDEYWRNIAGGIAKLSDEVSAAARKLCGDIAVFGNRLASAEEYAPISKDILSYFSQEAFAITGKYCVLNLYDRKDAAKYSFRWRCAFHWSDNDPDISKDSCRTDVIWLRRIPAGTFMMGSPSGELGRGKGENLHRVTLTQDFWIGQFAVSKGQWDYIMKPVEYTSGPCELPQTFVYWGDARNFCAKLNEEYGEQLPRGYRFDLPTEAQWEYACRAGTATALNNGKNLTETDSCPNLDEAAWYARNAEKKRHPGGKKRPNAWGLYDMHGNVWEWCMDWYKEDLWDETDPAGPALGSRRVMRGGSCSDSAWSCRSAARNCDTLAERYTNVGFRLALVPVRPGEEDSSGQPK